MGLRDILRRRRVEDEPEPEDDRPSVTPDEGELILAKLGIRVEDDRDDHAKRIDRTARAAEMAPPIEASLDPVGDPRGPEKAARAHEMRSDRAKAIDRRKSAAITLDADKYAEDPGRWDYPGLDTNFQGWVSDVGAAGGDREYTNGILSIGAADLELDEDEDPLQVDESEVVR